MIAHSGEYRKKNGQRGCVMMNNFIFENKTKVYFGKNVVKEHLGGLLSNYGETVMLAYGGGSVKRNGVYDGIMGILNAAGKRVVEFDRIMPNPTYAKVQDGAKLAWASAMAENGVLKIGKVTGFQAHQIEHQLGAYTNWSGPGGDPSRSVPPHLQVWCGAVCAVCSECLGYRTQRQRRGDGCRRYRRAGRVHQGDWPADYLYRAWHSR